MAAVSNVQDFGTGLVRFAVEFGGCFGGQKCWEKGGGE